MMSSGLNIRHDPAWSGDFQQLVERCNSALSEVRSLERVNGRLLRSYQQKGVLSRGRPSGNRVKIFGWEDVLSVLAVRGLLTSGVSLDLASSMLESSSVQDKIAYASPVSSLGFSGLDQAPVSRTADASGSALAPSSRAVSKVSELLRASGLPVSVPSGVLHGDPDFTDRAHSIPADPQVSYSAQSMGTPLLVQSTQSAPSGLGSASVPNALLAQYPSPQVPGAVSGSVWIEQVTHPHLRVSVRDPGSPLVAADRLAMADDLERIARLLRGSAVPSRS